ncbi:MAG: carboxypeptidase-like regulatory domain-containing protein, partial [Flavobacteriaceae bacterium]|nr:carboxypeptidase-like regulatory domain-containing protein [Flavobacteriaceae bacterium]
MRKLFLYVSVLFCNVVFSQNNNLTISGIINDSESKTALEYATVSILDSESKNLINGVVSNNNGFFNIVVSKGTYDIKLEYISFKTKILENIKVEESIDLGTVNLSIDENILDEIEVIGEKTEIEIKLDKTVYNIGKDLTLKGSSVSDVLDNLPSLEVDIDGNVSLRGNQSVRILINGKPSGLVGISSNDALKQFPSESVEKVEVITSPSARYNAEGTAGIINIVLRKNKLAGLNGSASLNLGDPKRIGLSSNLNYRTKKINLFSNIGEKTTNYINGFKNQTEYYTDSARNNFLNEGGDRNSERKSNYYNGGIEYFFDDKTSIVGSYVNSTSNQSTNT